MQGHDKVRKRIQERCSEALSGCNETDAVAIKTFLELRRGLDEFEEFQRKLPVHGRERIGKS